MSNQVILTYESCNLASSPLWTDYTADVKSAVIDYGLRQPRTSSPRVGKCTLTLNNQSKAYSHGTFSGAALSVGDRVRIRVTTAAMGYAMVVLPVVTAGNGSGMGGSTTIAATGSSIPIGSTGASGNGAGVNTGYAQSTYLTSGRLDSFIVHFNATVGSPSGLFQWSLVPDNNGIPNPGTILASGTFTPTASADNTVSGIATYIDPFTKYWFIFSPVVNQADGVYWQMQGITTLTDSSGGAAISYDNNTAGVSGVFAGWTQQETTNLQLSATTSFVSTGADQQVTVASVIGDVFLLTWEARADFDSFCNVDSSRILTSAENGPNQTDTYTNRWKQYSYSFTTTINATTVTARFRPGYRQQIPIRYRNISLTKNGGANLLVNGNFATGLISPWTVTGTGLTLSVERDSQIKFYGIIRVSPIDAHKAGGLKTQVVCEDMVGLLSRTSVQSAFQKNISPSALATVILANIPKWSPAATPPGILLETDDQSFATALDGQIPDTYKINAALDEIALSCYGRWWVDDDGTVRQVTRSYVPRRVAVAAKLTTTTKTPMKLTFVNGNSWQVNRAKLTYTPRTVGVSPVILGQMTAPYIKLPSLQNGYWGASPILNFVDLTTKKAIGGDTIITPLVPTTDYVVSERQGGLDGLGVDYTNDPTIKILHYKLTASTAQIFFQNTGPYTRWITQLRIRGFAVTRYDPVSYTFENAATLQQGEWPLNQTLPFTSNDDFVRALGGYLIYAFSGVWTEAPTVEFDNVVQAEGVELLTLQIGDCLSITDDQVAISVAQQHMITAIHLDLTPQGNYGVSNISYELERTDVNTYWIADDPVYGKADQTTRAYI